MSFTSWGWYRRWTADACLAVALCALACSGGQGGAEGATTDLPTGGRVPESELLECTTDADCAEGGVSLAAFLRGPDRFPVRVFGGTCEQVTAVRHKRMSGVGCNCLEAFRRLPEDGGPPMELSEDRTEWKPLSDPVVIGPAGVGCFYRDWVGNCLMDDAEFTGCSTDEQCQAWCAELDQRLVAAAAAVHDVSARYAACNDDNMCDYVLEIDGECFTDYSYSQRLSYDCALNDEQILQQDAVVEDEQTPECVRWSEPRELVVTVGDHTASAIQVVCLELR